MARASIELIAALRQAANHLRGGAHYAWGNHGACNCGHLLQVITRLPESAILTDAQTIPGEWTEIAEEACSVTGAPAALLFRHLEAAGLTPTDIHHLEYLDDKAVLKNLEGGFRWLRKNVREDVISYFEAFAGLLEDKLLHSITLEPELFAPGPARMAVEAV